MSTPTDLTVAQPGSGVQLWPEALDTPGLIPSHMKRAGAASIPILEVFQRILYRLHPRGRASDLELALAALGLWQAIRPAYQHLRDFFFWAATVQITIPESDAVSREVLTWMGSEVIAKSRARSAMLVTGGMENLNNNFPHQMRFPGPAGGGGRLDDEVLCLPPLGTRLFWVGFRPFLFTRSGGTNIHRNTILSGNMLNDQGQLANALTITTLGWSLKPLQKFTELCHEYKLNNLTGTTQVYFAGGHSDPYGDGWQSVSKAIRRLDTIDMDEEVKSDIIRDAEYYYSEQSRQFFADCGIPYRRGYLFHGPPGTGKSSFSAALAGHLQCDIYHINLASGDISDGSLHRLFLTLPRKCVVVIEDIDSAGIGREQGVSTQPPMEVPSSITDINRLMRAAQVPSPPMTSFHGREKQRNTVTLSGLLNAIDGNASQEGRLLIMTSNNPDALDAALTRPGRVDKKVYFGNMSRSAGKSIFLRLIGRSALAHDAVYTMAQIEQYATEFADKVPANTFTPAQVQNFLQGCRGDPLKALHEIDVWVAEAVHTKPDLEPPVVARSSDTSATFVSDLDDVEGAELAENDSETESFLV